MEQCLVPSSMPRIMASLSGSARLTKPVQKASDWKTLVRMVRARWGGMRLRSGSGSEYRLGFGISAIVYLGRFLDSRNNRGRTSRDWESERGQSFDEAWGS